MPEPEDLLRSLPAESPPSEVVTAALRVFRYRALAAIALAIALVMSAVILKSKIDDDSRLLVRIANSRYAGGVAGTPQNRSMDGLEVMVWEVVVDDSPTSYVHVQAWDTNGRDFTIALADPEVDGRATTLGELEGGGGGRDQTYAELWQEIRLPASAAEIDDLTFVVDVRGEGLDGSVPFEFEI